MASSSAQLPGPDPALAASAPGPVFVSRSALEASSRVHGEPRARDGGPLPRLFDRRVRWMLAFALALQLFAWWRVDGYQLADSVEFMERARTFVRGEEMVDTSAIRPFGFSLALAPFFVVADWFGLDDQRPVVWAIVLLQMAFGLLLTWRCMRLGAMLAGASGASCAGFVVATCPVFLRYSTQPVSDIAAGVCVAFALERLLDRTTFRRALVAGLWFALAFVVAYKTLLIALALIVFLFLRDRWKHGTSWRGVVAGLSLGVLIQCTLDWVLYGQFGASVWNYMVVNAGQAITSGLLKSYHFTVSVGHPVQWFLDRAGNTYRLTQNLLENPWDGPTDISVRGLQSSWYYVVELPAMLVWPVLGLTVLGALRAIVQRSWRTSLVLGALLTCVVVMSNKGSKDFRLWLPLFPFLAPLSAWGWDAIAAGWLAHRRTRREVLATVGAVATLALALHGLTSVNVRRFGGYWKALEWVEARTEASYARRRAEAPVLDRDGAPPRVKVGCAYHWAVFLRESPRVDVVKLPWQLNMWKQYEKKPDGGQREKTEDFAALEDLDVLVVHLPIFSQHRDLMEFLNARFEIAAVFYDQRTYDDLGPIFVLDRLGSNPRARRFFQDAPRGTDPAEFVRARQLERSYDFVAPEGGERLELLGVEYESLPPEEYGWITYHWRAATSFARDYKVLDRVTAPDEHDVWENNHALAYGARPTSELAPGAIVSESYLLVPAHEAYKTSAPVRPIGGSYRRGEWIPTRTWMRLRAYAPLDPKDEGPPRPVAELYPARPGASSFVRPPSAEGAWVAPDGARFSADDFVRVAAFFLPVRSAWRVPDDGRPISR